MKMKAPLAFVFGVGFLGSGAPAPGEAQAETGFRCDSGRLVSAGDHMLEVRDKCGEPDFADQRVEKRKVKYKVRRWIGGVAEEISEEREVEVVIDEWTYDLGPERFMRHVAFEDSRVVVVRTGKRGAKRRP
jgi:hypothetical protein